MALMQIDPLRRTCSNVDMVKKPLIIAVVGLIGSGKTEATRFLVERGFFRIGFNDVFYEAFKESGLPVNEPNERKVREGLRKEFGMGAMAIKSLPKLEAAFASGRNIVIESLYSWSEYKIIKEKYPESFRVLAVYAPPELRYLRLASRGVRPLARDAAVSRDYAEIEHLEKGGPIAMADWTIVNTGDATAFAVEINLLIDRIREYKKDPHGFPAGPDGSTADNAVFSDAA